MKKYLFVLMGTLCFLLVTRIAIAQNIEIGAQYALYDPATFPAYTPADKAPAPSSLGSFYASAGKTSGTIPAYTAQITVNLAAEVIWTGETFTLPNGWVLDEANSDPQNLTFYNSAPWTTEDPLFVIPVRAIAARSNPAVTAQTQVINIGGLWTDPDPSNNVTPTGVQVSNVLPVVLTNFKATAENNTTVNLSWETTMEANSDRFEVERSQEGNNWAKIGTVAAHKESNSLKSYSFIDVMPHTGENLYRLKMVDMDATFAYSSIRTVQIGTGNDLSVYPNPSSDFIKLRDAQNVTAVSIIDLKGNTVYQSGKVSKDEISVKNLVSGMYSVRIDRKDGGQSVQKLVVAR